MMIIEQHKNRVVSASTKNIQMWAEAKKTHTQQPPFYGHYAGQPALAGTSS